MNIDEKIKSVMAAVFDMPDQEINEDASPDTIKNWDSLHQMNLVVALEEEFNVTLDEQDMSNMLNFKLIRLTLSEHLDRK
jgi:acyl carrier protein